MRMRYRFEVKGGEVFMSITQLIITILGIALMVVGVFRLIGGVLEPISVIISLILIGVGFALATRRGITL